MRSFFLSALLASFSLSAMATADSGTFPGPEELAKIADARVKLVESIGKLADKDDPSAVATVLFAISGAFEGDPATVFTECISLLNSKNIAIRCLTAEVFLSANFHTSQAIGTLTDVMELPEKHVEYMRGKSTDLRVYAAKVLGEYQVRDAIDGMWKRYQEDPDDKLLFQLAEMGDRRPLEAIAPLLVKPAKVVHYADILGRLRATEYKELLEIPKLNALDQFKTTRALYWITGNESYLNELIARSEMGSIGYLMPIKSPKVEAIFKQSIYSKKAMISEAALTALHINYRGSQEVRDAVIDYLKGNSRDLQASAELVFRIAADLKDPEIDKIGSDFDTKRERAGWLPFYNRRNFPFTDPRMRCE
jgi:hypothetical protein